MNKRNVYLGFISIMFALVGFIELNLYLTGRITLLKFMIFSILISIGIIIIADSDLE